MSSGDAAMTRQNYLVERNRLRQKNYEETRKALEEEEVRIAKARAAEKEERQKAWAAQKANSTQNQTRPLPGGGPRSQRMADTESQRNVNVYQQEKEREAKVKEEYNRLYKEDMKNQLAEHAATLKKQREDEEEHMRQLRKVNEDRDLKVAENERIRMEEEKAYNEKMRQYNIREQQKRIEKEKARLQAERDLERLVGENDRHRAEMDERRQKNVTAMNKLMNEEFYKQRAKKQKDDKEKEAKELDLLVEHDRQLAADERAALEAKKEAYKAGLADAIRRDQEFRRKNNYDEAPETIRRRNELNAQSYKALQEDQKHLTKSRKHQYSDELMQQISQKQKYELEHLDEV